MTLGHPPGTTNSIRYKALFILQHVQRRCRPSINPISLNIKKMKTMLHGTSKPEKVAQQGGRTPKLTRLESWTNFRIAQEIILLLCTESHSKRRRTAAPEICLTCVHPLAYNSLFKQLCIKGGDDSPLYKRKQRLREVKLQVKGYTARK